MVVRVNGAGSITGLEAGGLPDSSITTAEIADAAVTAGKLSTGAPSWTSGGVLSFNSGYGSVATAYGCRAWCNADLTGAGSIRGSGNISSLGDQGTGRWQFNFTNAMPDTNYAAVGLQKPNADIVNMTGLHPNAAWTTWSTGTVAFVYANASGGLVDPLYGNVAIFR